MPKNKMLTIGEVSKITGIHIKSLRYYADIGVLKPAYVDPDTRYRYYTYHQLGVLDAVRTCIELDIPLKDFFMYTEDEGNIIHYASLLEQGKKIADEKINTIRKGVKKIEMLQRETIRSKTLQNQKNPMVVDLPAKKCYVSEINDELNEENYFDCIQSMFFDASLAGCKMGYEIGSVYFYERKSVRRYYFIEIVSAPKGYRKNIITIPAGRYISKCTTASRIEHAAEEFPDLFAKNHPKIVVETELFTADYNVEHPLLELSCSLSSTKDLN